MKELIRQEMRLTRRALSVVVRGRASTVICQKLCDHCDILSRIDQLGGASLVAVYLASPCEIDLTLFINAMLARGVALVAPQWNGTTYSLAVLKSLKADDLRQGPMRILEPKETEIVPSEKVGVWIIPGLAFTKTGERLGYGGGWYDRLLKTAPKDALKIGVAHSFQIVDELPTEPHDIRLTTVITDAS